MFLCMSKLEITGFICMLQKQIFWMLFVYYYLEDEQIVTTLLNVGEKQKYVLIQYFVNL